MDTEKKYNFAKKAAIALGGGAAVAGASAINRARGNESIMDNASFALADVADTGRYSGVGEGATSADMELFDGEFNMVETEVSYVGSQATNTDEPSVSLDDLSFREAFKVTRNACGGGGGVFEWHNCYYNTYTREEYEHLTDEDMEQLYLTYKQAADGNPDTLISSLQQTITTGSAGGSTTFMHYGYGINTTGYLTDGEDPEYEEGGETNEQEYDVMDDYDDNGEGFDAPLTSDPNDVDFNNLYT